MPKPDLCFGSEACGRLERVESCSVRKAEVLENKTLSFRGAKLDEGERSDEESLLNFCENALLVWASEIR